MTQHKKENLLSGIEGKVVVITGASSGIGEATALLLTERGANVVLGARGSERLEALAAHIANMGGEVAYAHTDVRRRDDLSNLVRLATERYGKLDVLVNNAGVMPISPLDDLRVQEWEEMIDVNLKGVLYGIAAALPVFRTQVFGHVVNIASTAAYLVLLWILDLHWSGCGGILEQSQGVHPVLWIEEHWMDSWLLRQRVLASY